MTTELTERYVGLLEAGEILRIHYMTVRRLVKRGRLPARTFAGKWLIDRADLERFRQTYDGTPGRPLQQPMFNRHQLAAALAASRSEATA